MGKQFVLLGASVARKRTPIRTTSLSEPGERSRTGDGGTRRYSQRGAETGGFAWQVPSLRERLREALASQALRVMPQRRLDAVH